SVVRSHWAVAKQRWPSLLSAHDGTVKFRFFKLFWGWFFSCFGGLLLALVPVVFALELLDAAGGVHVFHLSGEERMASRADFDGDILLGAARDELVAATTGHGGLFVFGVNSLFHDKCSTGSS